MSRCSLILASCSSPASTCRDRSSPGSRTWRGCSDRRQWPRSTDIAKKGRKVEAHRPWPRAVVASDAWRLAVQRSGRRARDHARAVGRHGRRASRAARGAIRRDRRVHARMSRRQVSLGRRAASAGEQARAHDRRPLRPEAGGLARYEAMARSRLLGRDASARQARRTRAAQARLTISARRGRGPAPDPGRPGACRHHRARAFPLHRQWRDGGAARRAARLCAQGHRVADGGRDARARRAARRPHLGRQHRGLRARLRAGGRGGARRSRCRRARFGCGR